MSVLSRLLRTAPPPGAAVEIAADRVSAASVSTRNGAPVVTAHAVEPLADGLVTPSLTGPNIHDTAAVAGAVSRVLDHVGRPRRVGLVVPDPVAKVSVLHFDETPARVEDLERLIRFQVRKSAPFSIDEAQLTWSAGTPRDRGGDCIVSIARRASIQEYEGVVAAAGAYPGLVDLASFNVANAILAGHAPAGDWLLVHAPAGYVSIAILRGQDLVFFRSRSTDGDDTVPDMVHQTAMYYEDRLQGGGFARVLLSGGPTGSDQRVRERIETRLGAPVEAIEAIEAIDAPGVVTLTDRIEVAPSLVDALAPVVGLIVRGRGDA